MGLRFVVGLAVLCFSGSPLRADLNHVEQCVVLLAAENGDGSFHVGSGFSVSSDGMIATSDSIAVNPSDGKPRRLWARASIDGKEYSAYPLKLLKRFGSGINSGRDIVILRVEGQHSQSFPFLHVGKEPVLGGEVFVVGFPIVDDANVLPFPFSRSGIVSSTKFKISGKPTVILDIPMVRGYGGSPVVDQESGEVMGVVAGTFTDHPEAGFMIADRISSKDILSAKRSETDDGDSTPQAAAEVKPGKALSEFLDLPQSE